MPIGFQNGGNYLTISQPWMKLGDGAWHAAAKMSMLLSDGVYHEVWPNTVIYTFSGTGYNMNIAACFGNPSAPSNYIFINNGTIGATPGAFALITGSFPSGAKLTIINNGYIQGYGGNGGAFQSNGALTPATQGGTALVLQFPTTLQNNGYIWAGGGGGGAYASYAHKGLTAPGGGGAGWQPGLMGYTPWRPGGGEYYWGSSNGTQTSGGPSLVYPPNGQGGDPGQAGTGWIPGAGFDNYVKSDPAQPGYAIINTSYLISMTGNNSNQLRGLLS